MSVKHRRRSSTQASQHNKMMRLTPLDTKYADAFINILNHVKQLPISIDFLELPDKKLYPDYYTTIESPISINEIEEKTATLESYDLDQLVDDFRLMADNAKTYNGSSSALAKNSLVILRAAEKMAREEDTENKELDLNEEFTKIVDVLANTEVDNIRIGDTFYENVNRRELPDYYKVIKTPMSFSTVLKNIESNKYQSIESFENHMNLIWQNAQTYNEEGSLVYDDSVYLQNEFNKLIEELKRKFNNNTSNGNSGHPRLKLRVKPPTKLKLHINLKRESAGEAAEIEDNSSPGVGDDSSAADDTAAHENSETPQATPRDTSQPPLPLGSIAAGNSTTSLIQEVSISSSRSVYKQIIRQPKQNAIPQPLIQNWFEYKFAAFKHSNENYTIQLPPQQSAITVTTSLKDSLSSSKRHEVELLVNGERVNPVPSSQYSNDSNPISKLTSRYELKLADGLNFVVFNVAVDASEDRKSEKIITEKASFWVIVL